MTTKAKPATKPARNTKPAAKREKPMSAAQAKRSTKRAATTTKPAAKTATTKRATATREFSAARVLLECGITNAKVGRALLRAHNVERTEKAIKAFFAARAKARAK